MCFSCFRRKKNNDKILVPSPYPAQPTAYNNDTYSIPIPATYQAYNKSYGGPYPLSHNNSIVPISTYAYDNQLPPMDSYRY